MAADERSMPFIKHLASSDRKIRTQALTSLRTFLSASATSSHLTPLDHLKLWKGLFYAVWMCDRPIPQQNLCAELAALLTVLPDDAVAPWLAAFYETMGREWTGIDVLRMEKFLLLVRRVFAAGLVWCRNDSKREEIMLKVFKEWPLEESGDLSKVPVGLRLHVLDLWVDEAEKAGMVGDESTEEDQQFLQRIRKIVKVQLKSPSKPVRARAKDGLADERLPWNQASGEEGEAGEMDDAEDGDFEGFND